jgi:ribonuclease R
MPEVYKRKIIKLLKHTDYKPVKLAQLAKALDVNSQDYPEFKSAFEQLRVAGRVSIGPKNLVTLPPMAGQIIGTFRANPKGFGFVTPLEPNLHGDLFIPPPATAGAMTGDLVSAKVLKTGKRAGQMRYNGRVNEILQRAQNRFVGTLIKTQQGWLVQPDGKAFTEPICIDDVTAKNARQKDKVVVEILTWPTEKYLPRGVIIDVLGKAGRYQSEIKSIINQYHLPGEFDEECTKQASLAAKKFKPEKLGQRDDITKKVIITIDPPDAKDFDDAISLEKDSSGNWVLGVHIADVGSFIPADSPLDIEAKERGNSVYLPGKTIPMLPEILSNGICSLQPKQKRFAKSAYITYDSKANIISRSFANSLISSTRRLTYIQADRILKGHTKGAAPEVIELLKNMETLSRAIKKRRAKNGMLHLDLPETELIMDKAGRVVDARPADDSYPHTIIEMFMVEANEAVAGLLDRLNVPFCRRIHPEPDTLSMKNLAALIRTLGLTLPRTPDRWAIQNLLAAVKDSDSSLAVNLAVLRSFEKAQYAPLHIGHFALASTHYCHFTSPIRRYADLLVHRLLDSYLMKQLPSSDIDLTQVGKHITFTEQRAEDAERELKMVLLLQMLSKRIGEELDCVVTGLAAFGVFAQSKKFGIEGLIQTQDLGPDIWKYDQKAQCIIGQRSGLTIHLGRPVKVRILSVNIPARQLNLSPVKPFTKTTTRKKKTKPPKKKAKKDRTQKTKKRKRGKSNR